MLSKEIIDRITVDKVGKLEFIDLITADKFGKLSSSRKEEGPSFIQALLDGGTEGWIDDGVGANSNSNPNPNLEGVVSTQYCRSWGWVFAYEGYALYKGKIRTGLGVVVRVGEGVGLSLGVGYR